MAEPIIAPSELPPTVDSHGPGLEQPAPTAAQEQASDEVFSQGLLALQMGAVAVGMIADNHRKEPLEEEEKRPATEAR